jgi:hypothetical protein
MVFRVQAWARPWGGSTFFSPHDIHEIGLLGQSFCVASYFEDHRSQGFGHFGLLAWIIVVLWLNKYGNFQSYSDRVVFLLAHILLWVRSTVKAWPWCLLCSLDYRIGQFIVRSQRNGQSIEKSGNSLSAQYYTEQSARAQWRESFAWCISRSTVMVRSWKTLFPRLENITQISRYFCIVTLMLQCRVVASFSQRVIR